VRCDDKLVPFPESQEEQPIIPHVFVEVRWEGNKATFPIRFDDKATLPLLLLGRRPTEGELIEYFLFGREPDEWDDNSVMPGQDSKAGSPDAPIDTRRILAYFVRQFVQAIPGIEAEIQRASYSQTALDAALQGPTSPLALAKCAFESLSRPQGLHEPEKTPIAVGFQLTEILAAFLRCRAGITDPKLQERFAPVVDRCRNWLSDCVARYPELQEAGFQDYSKRITGSAT